MSFPDLESREKKIFSQNGEDGVIEALFETIGVTNRYFVEIGVGDATECNTAALLERGWRGLMMDCRFPSANPLVSIKKEFVTAENVNDLLRKYGAPEEFDLLSIDVDGNDFWIWAAITARPRVVVIEYNSSVPPDECCAIVYDPTFFFRCTDYFGGSLLAFKELGKRKGYTLVYCDRDGVNAFLVADEALPPDYRERPIEEIYRPPNYFGRGARWRPDPKQRMIDPFYGWNAAYFHAEVAWWH
jgi:hypothetical protein